MRTIGAAHLSFLPNFITILKPMSASVVQPAIEQLSFSNGEVQKWIPALYQMHYLQNLDMLV